VEEDQHGFVLISAAADLIFDAMTLDGDKTHAVYFIDMFLGFSQCIIMPTRIAE